jgi:xanthine dehydrogenase accessory factor
MSGPAPIDFARRFTALAEAGERFAVATVVSVEGSASARPGAKAILDARGQLVFGWVGGGCAEATVRDAALAALEERRPRLIRLDLDDEVLGVGMPCGGFMNVYVEPVIPAPKLWVLGHGKIAETTARIASLLELHVTVADPLATPEGFPTADVRITDDTDYAKVECDAQTCVVITTQHKSDYEALERVLRQGPGYVGLVASPKRTALLLERLREDGFSPDELRRVSAPCGLDLGSETPQEIALSILAEVVRHLRGRGSGRALAEVRGVKVTDSGVELSEGPSADDKCPR